MRAWFESVPLTKIWISAAPVCRRRVKSDGISKAPSTVRFIISVAGYLIVIFGDLGVLNIPLGHLLLGGVVLLGGDVEALLVRRQLRRDLGGLGLVSRLGVALLSGGLDLLVPCRLDLAGAVVLLLLRRRLLLVGLLLVPRLLVLRRVRGRGRRGRREGRPGLLLIRIIGWLVAHAVPSGAAPIAALSASMTRHRLGWRTKR